MRIVLSGGGTGGHITPILAIADALKAQQPGVRLTYIGEKSPVTQDLLRGSGLPVYYIRAGKFRRYSTERWLRRLTDVKTISLNVRDSVRIVAGLGKSLRLLRRLKPDVVFAKGGYVGLPVGLAAGILRIPLVIHESDTRAGLTNRTLARYAKTIAVGWPLSNYPGWSKRQVVLTGNPIRLKQFTKSTAQARQHFKLEAGLPTVTIVGGSSGSHQLNQAIFDQLVKLLPDYQIIHVAGHVDFARARAVRQGLPKELRDRYHPYSFLKKDMGQALKVASVVIARGGANSFAELAYLGKPSIIVPHAELSDQVKNAKTVEAAGAARVLSQEQLATPKLAKTIGQLVGSGGKAKAAKIKGFGQPKAAENVAKLIIEAANGA